ncbi:F-box/LRR-repeat protein At3g58900-like [Salvia hispanica]|uniref:F-box/LRR-repeat protein At3g58900-like n=1 Tax=Salvia hispanica TaxID=49212 RepID=UPI0020095617|nr:F-box/LRR-repeat protein At3g58900-like [Salvia hispanica]
MDVHNGSSQKAKASKCRRDFFSELPNPILEHILSFLPLKDAIKTALLRRFGDQWHGIRVLDFNSCYYHYNDGPDHNTDHFNEIFTNVIRRVLDLHDNSTLDRVSLGFCFRLTYTREEPQEPDLADFVEWEARASAEIEKLIRYAMSRKVKVLDLDLNGDEPVERWELYKLPDVLRSDDLTYVKLAAFDMTSCNVIDLKSLKTLVLSNVSLSYGVMEAILLHCPVLQDLSLARCHCFEVVKCKNP